MEQEALMAEVKPEVVFFYELIREVLVGNVRIPKFQRPFVWRPDQMLDLLTSIRLQYPIGSLLLWDTDLPITSSESIGLIQVGACKPGVTSYVLDGQQRLSTLVCALQMPEIAKEGNVVIPDLNRWCIWFNAESKTFEHHKADELPKDWHFPLWKLMDTVAFLEECSRILQSGHASAKIFVANIQALTRTFSSYKIPVIRLKNTNLAQAVDIFSRLNSKGQKISPDQMAAALSYRENNGQPAFNLSEKIDKLIEKLAKHGFGELDRAVVLRTVLATMEVDIYSKDWTFLTHPKPDELAMPLEKAIAQANHALLKAVKFLHSVNVKTTRLLPYAMQLLAIAAFFLKCKNPSPEQVVFLRRWFWVSSFTCRFGASNPSQNNAIVAEFRDEISKNRSPVALRNMRMDTAAEPFPADFDMRSARARTVLLMLLSLKPKDQDGKEVSEPWRQLAESGTDSIGRVFSTVPNSQLAASPANRIFQINLEKRPQAFVWLKNLESNSNHELRKGILESHGISQEMFDMLLKGQKQAFLSKRQEHLISLERQFMTNEKVTLPLEMEAKPTSIDTE